jgi:hypothetical protein
MARTSTTVPRFQQFLRMMSFVWCHVSRQVSRYAACILKMEAFVKQVQTLLFARQHTKVPTNHQPINQSLDPRSIPTGSRQLSNKCASSSEGQFPTHRPRTRQMSAQATLSAMWGKPESKRPPPATVDPEAPTPSKRQATGEGIVDLTEEPVASPSVDKTPEQASSSKPAASPAKKGGGMTRRCHWWASMGPSTLTSALAGQC